MFRVYVQGEEVGEYPTFTEAFQVFWPIAGNEAVGDSAIVWCEAAGEGRLDLPQIRTLARAFGLLTEDGKSVVKTAPSPTFVPVVMGREVGRFSSFVEAFVAFYHAFQAEKRDCGGWIHRPACYVEWHEGGGVHALDFEEVEEMAHVLGLVNDAGELIDG